MPTPVIGGFHHVAVQVRDLAIAERFYNGVLGLPVLRRWPAEDGGERSLWLGLANGSFLAIEKASRDAVPAAISGFIAGHAGWHVVALGIQAADREVWEQHLTAHAVEIVHRSRWTLYIRDPDGNRVGLSHHPDDP